MLHTIITFSSWKLFFLPNMEFATPISFLWILNFCCANSKVFSWWILCFWYLSHHFVSLAWVLQNSLNVIWWHWNFNLRCHWIKEIIVDSNVSFNLLGHWFSNTLKCNLVLNLLYLTVAVGTMSVAHVFDPKLCRWFSTVDWVLKVGHNVLFCGFQEHEGKGGELGEKAVGSSEANLDFASSCEK